MSKKMLKRSLALGALMAFVITGSAMAESVPVKNGETYTDNVFTNTDSSDVKLENTFVGTKTENVVFSGPSKNNIRAYGSMATAYVADINQILLQGKYGDGIAPFLGCDGGVTTIENVGSITTDGDDVDTYVSMAFNAQGGSVIGRNIGSVYIYNVSNAIMAQTMPHYKLDKTYDYGVGGLVDLEVNGDFTLKNIKGSTTVAAATMNQYDKDVQNKTRIKANNITIETAGTANAVRAYGYNGYVGKNKIELEAAEDINITGGTAVRAQNGTNVGDAFVELKAGNVINLTGREYAIFAGTNGKVSLDAATANIEGAMFVDGTSTLDLSKINDLVLEGLEADNENAAIRVEDNGILKVNTNGTLAIDEAQVGVYKIVDGVGENAMWTDANLAYDRIEFFATGAVTDNVYSVTYKAAEQLTETEKEEAQKEYIAATGGEALAVPGLVGSAAGQGSVMEKTAPGAKQFLSEIAADPNMPKETKAAVINSAAQLAEAGGNSSTAVNVAGNVSGATTGRLSFNGGGHGGGHKGGHGVGLFEEGSGAAIWAQYLHGKDKGEDVPMEGGVSNYESNYDGIVLGVDFKRVGKYQSGMAFNYGEGDSKGYTSGGISTKSDYDFWGIGYYGNIRNEDTNFIFDVNYAQSESDVTQNNITGEIEASPETTTWTVGVKAEKLYQNGNVQIVPYAGLRYMSVDTDEYTSKVNGDALFNYAPERQDIWLLPVGVSLKQEVVNDNGWTVTPKVDLSYIWAFGDTDSSMELTIPGVEGSTDNLGFTVMDDGSLLGMVGIEAAKGDWTFGVSYSYQKGDHTESKKWYVDAKYSF